MGLQAWLGLGAQMMLSGTCLSLLVLSFLIWLDDPFMGSRRPLET